MKLGNQVTVSDPCYSPGTWCSAIVDNVVEGNYRGFVKYINTDWGVRVGELIAVHKLYEINSDDKRWRLKSRDIGVDSGQCGIFDTKKYEENKKLDEEAKESSTYDVFDNSHFYGKCCNNTKDPYHWGFVEDFGVVCSSGFGDGSYDLYTIESPEGKVVAFKVVFITD